MSEEQLDYSAKLLAENIKLEEELGDANYCITQLHKIRKQEKELLKEYILTHKIYDEVKFKSELLKIIGGDDNE